MELVKFVVVGDRKNISDYYEYVNIILTKTKMLGYTDRYQVDSDDQYPNTIFCCIYQNEFVFKIVFDFSTFGGVKQLMIDISSDNYVVDVNQSYIEDLKLYIKNSIVKDWEKIVWLYDEDAYLLSKALYSRFYATENKIRRFINEFMVKTFGTNWWDLLPDQLIKDKYNSRFKGYKTVVPGFNNVDDHLLSIDVGDLFKILTMKRMEWSPSYDKNIETLLVGVAAGKECKIVERLKKQLTVKEDFWDQYFKGYFDSEFTESYKEFEANRNHVAHSKILDRSAYNSICRLIDKIDKYLERAIEELYKNKKSHEQLQAEVEKYEELLLEAKQNDTGVRIRDVNSIIDEFESVLEEKFIDIVEALRFREDIDISKMKFDCNSYSGELFSATSKVTNERLDFIYSMDIIDEEGHESKLTITCKQSPFSIDRLETSERFRVIISYVNGAVEYNDEQGYYMPITNDGIPKSDIDCYLDTMVEFINSKLESLKEYVDSIKYETVKDGGHLPIASGCYCDECYEEYICIDENLSEVGTCLNCGAHYDIAECERCGQNFIDYEGDEIKLCDQCKEYYDKQ